MPGREVEQSRPAPLTGIELDRATSFLRAADQIPHGEFEKDGTFVVISQDEHNVYIHANKLWSADLLSFDPASHRIALDASGAVEVQDATGQTVNRVEPTNIRPVDQEDWRPAVYLEKSGIEVLALQPWVVGPTEFVVIDLFDHRLIGHEIEDIASRPNTVRVADFIE